LAAHNKVYLKFRVYQVDDWSATDSFKLIIDGVLQ